MKQYMLNYIEQVKRDYPDVELDINKRWEQGKEHHPKSIKIMGALCDLDFALNNDHFCWKMGGDGDNGEALMYLLDIIFEQEDIDEKVQDRL